MGKPQYEGMIMELLKRLQNWYQMHCNGDWEHSYGVKIDTLDNPGWKLSVDLSDTLLENVDFQEVCEGTSENKNRFWIDCRKKDNTFIGMGSVDSLEKLLSIFLEWSEHNCDTSGWDEAVNTMIRQLESCNDVEQLRKMYRNIDSIPDEHIRKQELTRLFKVKWDDLTNHTTQNW